MRGMNAQGRPAKEIDEYRVPRLRAARNRRGMKQDQVAAKLGIARQTVSKWETGETEVTVQELQRLAELYGCEPRDLLPRGWVPDSEPLSAEEAARVLSPHSTEDVKNLLREGRQAGYSTKDWEKPLKDDPRFKTALSLLGLLHTDLVEAILHVANRLEEGEAKHVPPRDRAQRS